MCLTVDKVAPSSDALTDQQTERRQIAQAGKRQFLNSAVHRQCNHNTDDRTVNRNAALPDGGATSLPWGMSIDGASPVHPTFLYESLWNFVGFLVLHFYSKKRKFKGEMALLYVAWYGLGRAWIEGLRTDSLYLGPVRVSQLLAGISCIAAIVVLVRQYNRIKVEKAFYAPEQDKADEKKGE